MTKQKNYSFLIKNFKKLTSKYKDIKLLIIGSGEEKNYLKNLIKELDILEKVKLIDQELNIYKYLKNSDYYISTSIWEGSSLAMIDAAYMGIPILCSDCPSGRKEFIGENEISGMYINFPDPWEGNERNRIIQLPLFETLDKVLKVGGKLFFKTDHDAYYEDVLELSKELKNYKVVYNTCDLHNSEKSENNILTEFEELFLNKFQKNINYIEIEKIR